MADIQSWGTNCEAGNENNLSTCIGDCASSPKNQNPHSQAEASKKTADTFCNIFEKERAASCYHASKTCSYKVAALSSIGDRSVHYKLDQYRDCQGEDVGSREEDVEPLSLDADKSIEDTSEHQNDSCYRHAWRDTWVYR